MTISSVLRQLTVSPRVPYLHSAVFLGDFRESLGPVDEADYSAKISINITTVSSAAAIQRRSQARTKRSPKVFLRRYQNLQKPPRARCVSSPPPSLKRKPHEPQSRQPG